MKLSAPWLEVPATRALMAALDAAGSQALYVGGCVRNTLLGAPVADIDVATDALPQTVSDIGKRAGFRVVPTGFDHGTVTVIVDGLAHEVTTFRRDVATDGRRAVVAYSQDVAEDARRRDFTMNALYARADGTLIDPLGGLYDLHARRVRFIGDPATRIAEDYLRILRFFRFHAWYGDPAGGLDAEGLAACAELADGLDQISRERIGAEMMRLLDADDPGPALGGMAASGVLARIVPGADLRGVLPLIALEPRDDRMALRRLAALGGEGVADRFRLSKADARKLAALRDNIGAPDSAAELAYRQGAQMARDIMLLRAALLEQPVPPTLDTDIARGAEARMPVRALDLAQSGKALGAELARLERLWIASGFALTREDLLADARGRS